MSQPFLAEIMIFTGGFAPKNWALCDGQLMPISQNTALFALLGTTYGGNGTSNFALPNFQGCAPMHAGQGPGLSLRDLGETGGEQTVTLLQTEMPAHSHNAKGVSGTTSASPANDAWGSGGRLGGGLLYTASVPASNVQMNPFATAPSGGSQPHNNLQPYLGLTFCIALAGIFPARS